jgi:hypothetical protein
VSRPGLLTLSFRPSGPGLAFLPAAPPPPALALFHWPLLDPEFDITAHLPLGGLHEEIRTVIRRAFLTRVLPPAVARSLGEVASCSCSVSAKNRLQCIIMHTFVHIYGL